jgi:phage FluMu protein Com
MKILVKEEQYDKLKHKCPHCKKMNRKKLVEYK